MKEGNNKINSPIAFEKRKMEGKTVWERKIIFNYKSNFIMQSSTKLAKYINLQWQDQANVDIYFSYRMASFLFHIDILFSD